MTLPDLFLFCFAVGTVWSVATVALGGLHLGHGHAPHPHTGTARAGGHGHVHGGSHSSWLSSMAHPNSLAAFLAWFGGVGYLLTRHTGWRFWADLVVALLAGVAGAWILASFLRLLQSRDQPLDPADYQMVGVLGKVSAPIRPNGVGEVIYSRDGARRPVAARSADASLIGRGEEVIVTRYEHGIAFVRTWAAMVPQSSATDPAEKTLQKETNNVE